MLQTGMDMSVRIYDSRDEMKADEYRYWQGRPGHERMRAVAELTLSLYEMKEPARDVRRLQKTLVCLQRPRRSISGGRRIRGFVLRAASCDQRPRPIHQGGPSERQWDLRGPW